MSDIYISYADEDWRKARALAEIMGRYGWSVWWDRTIPSGRSLYGVLAQALESAKCVVVLWSKTSIGSPWVGAEAAEAIRRRILVPALIEDVEVPRPFAVVNATDLSSFQGPAARPQVEHLLHSVASHVDPRHAPAPRPIVARRFGSRERERSGDAAQGRGADRPASHPRIPSYAGVVAAGCMVASGLALVAYGAYNEQARRSAAEQAAERERTTLDARESRILERIAQDADATSRAVKEETNRLLARQQEFQQQAAQQAATQRRLAKELADRLEAAEKLASARASASAPQPSSPLATAAAPNSAEQSMTAAAVSPAVQAPPSGPSGATASVASSVPPGGAVPSAQSAPAAPAIPPTQQTSTDTRTAIADGIQKWSEVARTVDKLMTEKREDKERPRKGDATQSETHHEEMVKRSSDVLNAVIGAIRPSGPDKAAPGPAAEPSSGPGVDASDPAPQVSTAAPYPMASGTPSQTGLPAPAPYPPSGAAAPSQTATTSSYAPVAHGRSARNLPQVDVVGASLLINGRAAPGNLYSGVCPAALEFHWTLASGGTPTHVVYAISRKFGHMATNGQAVAIAVENHPVTVTERFWVGERAAPGTVVDGWSQLNVTAPGRQSQRVPFAVRCARA